MLKITTFTLFFFCLVSRNAAFADAERIWTNTTAQKFIIEAGKKIQNLNEQRKPATDMEMANWLYGWNQVYDEYIEGAITTAIPEPPVDKIGTIKIVENAALQSTKEGGDSLGVALEAADFLSALFNEGALFPRRADLADCWEKVVLTEQEDVRLMIEATNGCIALRSARPVKLK
jgi:hypothetical protein